ncbi:MAG: VWA domain-containing protein [Dehalococcoidia bacterium]
MISYKYSRWDGTQQPFQIAAEELLDELSKDLLTYGDLQTALRRLMERGVQTKQGMRLAGLRDLMRRLQQERQRQLGQYNLDSMFDDLKEKLDNVIEKERGGLQKRLEDASGQPQEGEEAEKLQKLLEDMVARKREFLDNLPQSFGGKVKELSDYEFVDDEARQEFQELLDLLRQRMLDPYVRDMEQRLRDMTPEQLEALKDMLNALNQMLEQQRMGMQPDYQGFMQQYGQFFPGAPDNLEDFIEQLQRQIAQMQSLMDSLSPEARQSLEELLESQLLDDELRNEMAQLAANLESLFPSEEFRNLYPFQGEEQVSWEEAMKLMEKLQSMDDLEKQLEHALRSRGLEGIDAAKLQEVLGEEARQEVEALQDLARALEEAGYIRRKGNRLELTPKGLRRIGQRALRDIFQSLKKDRQGSHDIHSRGIGVENTDETKSYEFGDPFNLHLPKTLLNAVERRGARVPVKLTPEDLEIYRPDHMTRSATVLLLDQSRSMDISGAFFAAKKVALALHSLITAQFPRDDFYVIGFAAYAQEVKGEMLAELDCSGEIPGTNMHHALMLSRRLLAKRKCENKQVIMVTDGEPTAHLEGGKAFFWYPPSMETIQATLREVKRCTRDAITLNIFMLDTSYYLMDFVNQVTKINKGRAFYTTPERLGEYILVDYISNKRKRVVP